MGVAFNPVLSAQTSVNVAKQHKPVRFGQNDNENNKTISNSQPQAPKAKGKVGKWLAGGLLGLALVGGGAGYHYRNEVKNALNTAYEILTLTVEYKNPVEAQGTVEKPSVVFVPTDPKRDPIWVLKDGSDVPPSLLAEKPEDRLALNQKLEAFHQAGTPVKIKGYKKFTKLNGEVNIIYVQDVQPLVKSN